jgi:hypothetical protein
MQGARVDQVMSDLEGEFGDGDTLRADVEARFLRYAAAHVQDFVPIFVERELRASRRRVPTGSSVGSLVTPSGPNSCDRPER